MKKLLPAFVAAPLFALQTETIHSSLLTYFETKTYTNSLQKIDARVYGIGGDVHYKGNEYKLIYEYGQANTKQPPLTKDLKNQKLFLRYAHTFKNRVSLHCNYLSILDDNIAITSGGRGYGAGMGYSYAKNITFDLTQYSVEYDDFKTYQSDFRFDIKKKIKAIKFQFSSINKYISLQDIHPNSFTKNAQSTYFTSGVKLHAHYNSYHFGMGAYFGKRAFAIMNDGFKIQHHAMEFHKTYALGVGKKFTNTVFRVQYIYNEATELPLNNPNVEINNIRFILNYKL